TSSASSSANKKPEYVKTMEKKEDKKADEKKRDMSKVLLDSDESSSSAEETIAEVAYYTSESKSESEYETSKYYDNSTNYGLFVNDNDDQEIFHDAIESASENFIENHIDSQKTDKSEVDHNGSEEKEHLIDKLCDSFDENNLSIFDDESVRISLVSKMPFRKRLRDSMNVHSKSNLNKSLPRTVHRWLLKMQPLAEPVAKWISRVERQIDKISKTPNSSGPIFKWVPKHITGNRALLTNFVKKFLGTVRFGNNDFAVIAGMEM
nr:hypothetical protein [Tanacetum cinerariifolium]